MVQDHYVTKIDIPLKVYFGFPNTDIRRIGSIDPLRELIRHPSLYFSRRKNTTTPEIKRAITPVRTRAIFAVFFDEKAVFLRLHKGIK